MIKVKVGDKFTATIDQIHVEGTIQIEDGYVYLCQDRCNNGWHCKDKLGYVYSWYVSTLEGFNYVSLSYARVKNFQLLSNRKSRIENLYL